MIEKLKQNLRDIVQRIKLLGNTQKELKEITEGVRLQAKNEIVDMGKASKEVEDTKKKIEDELRQEVKEISGDFREEVKEVNKARLQVDGGANEVRKIVKTLYSTIDDLCANLYDIKNRVSTNGDGLQKKEGKVSDGSPNLLKRLFPNHWVVLAIVFFVIGWIIAVGLIGLNQIPIPCNGPVTLVVHRGGNPIYSPDVNLQPPLRGYLTAFFKNRNTTKASPRKFKEFLNDSRKSNDGKKSVLNESRKSIQRVNNYITCKPYSGNLFVEGEQVICSFPFKFPSISANSTIVSQECNKTWYRWFDADSHPDLSICPTNRIQNCSNPFSSWNRYNSSEELLLTSLDSGQQKLRISIVWDITTVLIVNNSGNESRLGNKSDETAIDYIVPNFYVCSKDEVLLIRQQERERNYQLILAFFALFGIFPAIYYLRNLYRN